MTGPTINNSSDVGITCGQCGCTFTGKGNLSDEVTKMFLKHYEELHI